MTAAKLPGGRAGLIGTAVIAAFVLFGLGSGCSPSAGNVPEYVPPGGSGSIPLPPGNGGNPGSGAVPAAGGNPAGGNIAGASAPGAGGVPAGGGAPPRGGSGGTPPASGGLPPVGGNCNVMVVDPTPLPQCPNCQGGRCVKASDYPNAPVSQLTMCDADDICLPDALVATKGNVALAHCTSVAGAEGRCTSLCIPSAAALAGFLPQDVCASSERCAPCYSPVDGSDTGLCRIGCDPGPTQPPVLFPTCCVDKGTTNARGRCVPRAVIPDGPAKQNLAKETCTGNNDPVCVPTVIIQNPSYMFPMCTSQLFIDPGKPGVCAPACIVNANPAGAALAQDDCANATDKCVPCTDPSTGMPSGACPTN